MGEIKINYEQARSEINHIKNEAHSKLSSTKKRLAHLEAIFNESEGAFVKEIRRQFQAEKKIIAASEDFFNEMCKALLKAVDTYEEQDNKIAESMDKAIS